MNVVVKLKERALQAAQKIATHIVAPAVLADLEATIRDRVDRYQVIIAGLESDVLILRAQIDLLEREKRDLGSQLARACAERDQLTLSNRVLSEARDENSAFITKLRDKVFALEAQVLSQVHPAPIDILPPIDVREHLDPDSDVPTPR